MENGVEKPPLSSENEITRTADGGVSVLNLTDDVVQVFHEEEPVVAEGGQDKDDDGDEEASKPESLLETKTADGGSSLLNLADNVVHVFHEDEGVEVEGRDKVDDEGEPLLSEEYETKTADADDTMKLGDNVLHRFHQKMNSEGDDVFEEAIMDDNPPPPQPAAAERQVDHSTMPVPSEEAFPSEDFHSLPEVNGKVGADEVNQGDKFEEVVDTDLPGEDTVEALNKFKVADGVNADQLLSEELPSVVFSNEQGVGEEVFSTPKVVPGDVKLELNGDPDVAAHVESGKEDTIKVVGESGKVDTVQVFVDDDNGKELQLEESLDGLVCNGEEDDNKASALIAIGESMQLTDAQLESNGSYGAVFHDKADDRSSIKSELEDEPAETIFYEDGQSVNGIFDASSVHYDTKSRKTENGSSEKNRLEEKPIAVAKPFDLDEVVSDEIALSDGCDESEKVFSKQGEICEMRHAMASVDTFVMEEIQTAELKKTSSNLGVSVHQGADAEKELSDTIIDLAELGEKDSPALEAQHQCESTEEVSVVKEPKLQKMQDEGKEEYLPSIETPNDSGSAREPEIHHSAEPVQALRHRPAGLGGAAPLLEPTSRALQQPRVNGAAPQRQAELVEDPTSGEGDGNDETREKLQMIRVKFLRLAHRLGQTPHNVVVAQVLYRLGLAEQLRGRTSGRAGAFSFDRASAMAEQLESAGQGPLDFSCTIMVLGKTGVGKSATINSIFDEIKFSTDAFQSGTKKVQDVVGTVQGIKVRVIDTPGLLPCWSDQRQNEKILQSVKRFIKKTPPDIVLYLDRLDMQNRDFGDLPLLRTITEIFGPSIWFNAIVVLTHAASAPPDGPNGLSSSYEMFVTQRSHVVQQAIRQAAGDMRLMNPVSLVENHSLCRTNRAGQRVLPNGQVWKPHLLLLSFASKILAEANTLLKLQDNPPGKPFANRPRVPPLPFLLSSLLQSRPPLKLPEEQFGDEDDLDEDLDLSDSDDESEYDELPPFKRLTQAQLAKLSKAQKKAYFDELEYREKLFMKKQLREERKRRKLLKKMAATANKEVPNDNTESAEEEAGGGASVPVAMPDFSLPASFDSDNPSHRYRFLDTSNPWLVRPVLETHGWDHDVGYEGINVERLFVVKDKIPVSFSGQATKDKKESNLQMELTSSIKHNEGKATSLGFDMQPIGKDMSYTLRSETRFSNFRRNRTSAGVSVTLLGDALTAGAKVEDRLIVNNRFRLVLTGGAMTGRGDVAYGGSLEATLRDKDYPLGRMLSTLGLSIMDWHGDLAIGCNIQSQVPIGRSSNLVARANLNNRGSGQVSIRVNSSEQLQIALVGLLPLVRKALSFYQQNLYGE